MKNKIIVLSGAGMSAESGINTFRDADGLWEGHDVMTVASPEGFATNPELVLDFYNQRRRQLLQVAPNAGHNALVTLAKHHDVEIITQNVDDLHERAGSTNVIHLHGELLKSRSSIDENLVFDCKDDINLGDLCPQGSQIRPDIVWFGEMVPSLDLAITKIQDADIVIIVGTSMQVYPAASLVHYAPLNAKVYYIDPKPAIDFNFQNPERLEVRSEKATTGLTSLVNSLC